MKKVYLIVVLALVLLLGACSTTEVATEVATEEIPPPPTPEAGMATVTGRVYSDETGEPLPGAIMRLAETVRPEEGGGENDVFVLDLAFSPGTRTDESGVFVFENVDPMEYVVVVGDVERTYVVIPDETGKPATWIALPNEILDVGSLHVSLGLEDL